MHTIINKISIQYIGVYIIAHLVIVTVILVACIPICA